MIRKATRKDIKKLADIDVKCNDPVDTVLGWNNDDVPRYIRERFDKGLETFFIYKDKEDHKGYITVIDDFAAYSSCEIRWLAVKEHYQRKGIGRKLVEAAHEHARKLGRKRVFLYTHELRKDSAVRFYKKLGYRIINRFPGYYSNGDTSILMGKTLK